MSQPEAQIEVQPRDESMNVTSAEASSAVFPSIVGRPAHQGQMVGMGARVAGGAEDTRDDGARYAHSASSNYHHPGGSYPSFGGGRGSYPSFGGGVSYPSGDRRPVGLISSEEVEFDVNRAGNEAYDGFFHRNAYHYLIFGIFHYTAVLDDKLAAEEKFEYASLPTVLTKMTGPRYVLLNYKYTSRPTGDGETCAMNKHLFIYWAPESSTDKPVFDCALEPFKKKLVGVDGFIFHSASTPDALDEQVILNLVL